MAKNFHLNYKQMWKTVHMCKYMENEEIVVNSESYEPEDGSFTFAGKVKDEAPDAVWEGLEVEANGWSIFEMDGEGEVSQNGFEEVEDA